jgi:hypothetical protein
MYNSDTEMIVNVEKWLHCATDDEIQNYWKG